MTIDEKALLLCRTWANEALFRIGEGNPSVAAEILMMMIGFIDRSYKEIRDAVQP